MTDQTGELLVGSREGELTSGSVCEANGAKPADAALAGKTRPVEMYVGYVGGQWDTAEVRVPADTPEEKIPAVAEKRILALQAGRGLTVAFAGVYNLPELHDDIQCAGPCGTSYEEGSNDFCTGCGRCFDCCADNPDCPLGGGGYEVKCYRTAQDYRGLVCAETLDGFGTMAEAEGAARKALSTYEVAKAQSYDREEIEVLTRDGVTV